MIVIVIISKPKQRRWRKVSKYFDGYASFDYKEMSKEKLISELKEKVRYIGEIKRSHNDEIAKIQSAKDKQIADLEAKLAVSEEINKLVNEQLEDMERSKLAWENKYFKLEKQLAEWQDGTIICKWTDAENKVKELEYQLAEKDKLIEELKHYNDRLAQGIYHSYGEHFILKIKQDKISFCIEKLEQVKKFVIRQLFITTKDCSDLDRAEAKGCNELREETIKEIDNQIKAIKEGR